MSRFDAAIGLRNPKTIRARTGTQMTFEFPPACSAFGAGPTSQTSFSSFPYQAFRLATQKSIFGQVTPVATIAARFSLRANNDNSQIAVPPCPACPEGRGHRDARRPRVVRLVRRQRRERETAR